VGSVLMPRPASTITATEEATSQEEPTRFRACRVDGPDQAAEDTDGEEEVNPAEETRSRAVHLGEDPDGDLQHAHVGQPWVASDSLSSYNRKEHIQRSNVDETDQNSFLQCIRVRFLS
jgi:hypothetical protein